MKSIASSVMVTKVSVVAKNIYMQARNILTNFSPNPARKSPNLQLWDDYISRPWSRLVLQLAELFDIVVNRELFRVKTFIEIRLKHGLKIYA